MTITIPGKNIGASLGGTTTEPFYVRQPNTFIIGAPKCGTTAMAEYLRQHPQVFFSSPKEPHYFVAEEMLRKSRFPEASDYSALFEHAGNEHIVVAEGSVWYLYSQTAVQKIHHHDPAAKIIAMLRRPDEMVYSMHNQAVISHNEDIEDFGTAWALSRNNQRTRYPEYCREPSLLKYNEIASYGKQLQRVFAIFPENQVKVILFEDFRKETRSVYKQTCEFLGLDTKYEPLFEVVNENRELRSLALGKVLKYPPASASKVLRKVKRALGMEDVGIRSYFQKMNAQKSQRAILPEPLRLEIIENYRDDIRLLETLIDRDLQSWLV